ncbi:MAG TPA: amidohydrolase [bacterium]|nr:amidohydrolase [bacterium]
MASSAKPTICELPRSHADRPRHPDQQRAKLPLKARKDAALATLNGEHGAAAGNGQGLTKAELVAWRRTVHMFPELGYQESYTQELILSELKAMGVSGKPLAGTGVMADLKAKAPGKTLMLRSDIDALPVQEENDHAFVSRHPKVMHACGHDAHIAILLGATKLLRQQPLGQGTVRLNFQPAEEGLNGAGAMIEAGILQGVDATIGYHIWQHLPVGQIGVVTGPAMAAVDRFEITLEGKGGHAAMPSKAIDPIVIAAQLITAFQSIVSRNMNPFDTAVVSVCSLHGGDAFNVIPPRVTMEGTVRTFNPAVQDLIERRMGELVRGIPKSYGATGTLAYHRENPALVNDATMADFCRQIAAEVVGKKNVKNPEPSMGGEDHAFYQELVPGCYVFLGSAPKKREIFFHHHPRFDFDEDVLPIGAEFMARAARAWLG